MVEAIEHLFNPVPLIAGPVAWAAAAGILINFGSAKLFGHDHHLDLNQRAAVLRRHDRSPPFQTRCGGLRGQPHRIALTP